MREIANILAILCSMSVPSPAGIYGAGSAPGMSGNSYPSAQMPLDSAVTRIAPVQQDYGVGRIEVFGHPYLGYCAVESVPDEASFGFFYDYNRFAWIIWDLSVIPEDAEIVKVEIEHELYPWSSNATGIRYWYVKMDSIYLPPPDCQIANDKFWDCTVYLDVDMGTLPGVRRYCLYERARADVAAAVAGRTYFSIGLSASQTLFKLGGAKIPGWNSGGPELLVTWTRTVGVGNRSWSAIKSLYFQ